MSTNSAIEWTEATWNPIVGCTIISPGCTNCYAMRMARRLESMGQKKYSGLTKIYGKNPKWNGVVRLDENSLDIPMKWKTGRYIFVNSMADLFHERVPFDFIERIFDIMKKTPQHTYQVLTKRAEKLELVSKNLDWPPNVWMGVSVENMDYKFRINHLRRTGASIKFLSLEPLLGSLGKLDLTNIDWVIAGGESGPMARPMKPDWVRSIRDQCISQNVAFHFKQWGGVNKKKNGRMLDERTWDELPAAAA